jgi:nitroimidazol reductase NimA-like FMN-containing flavoprotein (pyridoxamine 5'-phosphate oxidase superfamily)
MIIKEMTPTEINELLEQTKFGRLACAHDGQPYIVPLNFAYHLGALYSFTTVGQKIEWMRANPKVCVEFDHISATDHWQSVVVTGRYEELPKDSVHGDERLVAYELLSKRAEWWEPAYVKTVIRDHERPIEPVYFRILVTEKTGHKATKIQ